MANPLSTTEPWDSANKSWANIIQPFINNPLIQGKQISNIVLTANVPRTFNHMLGGNFHGWFIVDQNAQANVWRTQPTNQTTLTLQSSATITISIWVY